MQYPILLIPETTTGLLHRDQYFHTNPSNFITRLPLNSKLTYSLAYILQGIFRLLTIERMGKGFDESPVRADKH